MYTQREIKKVQNRLLEMGKCIAGILERNNIPYFITYGTLLGAVRHQGFIPWDDDFDIYLFADSYEQAMLALEEELPSDMFLENENTEPLFFHGWSHIKDLNSQTKCELYPQDGSYSHQGISVDLYKITKVKESEESAFLLKEHIAYLNRRNDKGLIDATLYRNKMAALLCELSLVESSNEKDDIENDNDIFACPGIYKDFLYPHELFPLKKYKFEDAIFYGPQNADVFLSRCYNHYMQLPAKNKRHPHYSEVIFFEE